MKSKILHGDFAKVLQKFPNDSFHAVITDPPYGINIIGQKWDDDIAHQPDTWRQICRVLKPGGFVASFAATRTYHLITAAIANAGMEIRDMLAWINSDGMPAAQDVGRRANNPALYDIKTGLKPALEPAVIARKPIPAQKGGLIKYAAENGGLGAFHIRKARHPISGATLRHFQTNRKNYNFARIEQRHKSEIKKRGDINGCYEEQDSGRFTANVAIDPDDAPLFAPFFPPACNEKTAAAFFYYQRVFHGGGRGWAKHRHYDERDMNGAVKNNHPTVKPINLMAHLINLLTPDGGRILDPFAGSGSTIIAAELCGYESVGIEKDKHFAAIARARLRAAVKNAAKVK